jgi:hypothetical protein
MNHSFLFLKGKNSTGSLCLGREIKQGNWTGLFKFIPQQEPHLSPLTLHIKTWQQFPSALGGATVTNCNISSAERKHFPFWGLVGRAFRFWSAYINFLKLFFCTVRPGRYQKDILWYKNLCSIMVYLEDTCLVTYPPGITGKILLQQFFFCAR